MKCYLNFGGAWPEYEACRSIRQAKGDFLATAEELAQVGQTCEASLHIAKREDEINEYPDLVLSLGPRGGLVCQSP